MGAAVKAGSEEEGRCETRLSSGLRAGLEFLAADPELAHLLLVDSLAAARPVRLEHERVMTELAEALNPLVSELRGGELLHGEAALMLAGGLVSYLSGRVLAGEAKDLADAHGFLLEYLRAPSGAAAS